jgi:hypothetical protein
VENINVPGQNDEIDMNNGDVWGCMIRYHGTIETTKGRGYIPMI